MRFDGHPFELGIDLEIAEEFFLDHFLSVKRREVRAGTKADLLNFSRELGRILIAARNRAGNGIDDDVLGVRVFFGRGRVVDAKHGAGALDERGLEASAGAEYWPILDAGKLDAFEHAVETLLRGARGAPQAID